MNNKDKKMNKFKEEDGKIFLLTTKGTCKIWEAPGYERFMDWIYDYVLKRGDLGFVAFGDLGVYDSIEDDFVFATCSYMKEDLDDIFYMMKSKRVEIYLVKDKKSVWHLMVYSKYRNKVSSMEIKKYVEPAAITYIQKYEDKKPNPWIAKQLINRGRTDFIGKDDLLKSGYNYFQDDEDWEDREKYGAWEKM